MALIRPDGAIAAVAAFTGPQLHDIELSLATDGRADWASRRTLSAVLGYAFQQLDKPRVTVNANSERPDLVRLYERAGFQVEGLIRLGYGRADRVAMGMLRKECPWIGDRHGK